MADTFNLTPQPVRVSVPTKQMVEQALDVSDYDEVDALAGIVGVEGSTTGVGLKLLTGMQRDTSDGWVTLRWQCRTFAMLGLYVADPDSGVDTSLSGSLVRYQSTCRQVSLFGPPAANFRGSCAMNHPGVQGDEEAWSGRSAWSNPSGCP